MKKRRMTSLERRHQILEKAAEVFAEHGLDGARTRRIADACGVNEALLYKHFPSKEKLFVETMVHLHDKLADRWWSDVSHAPNGLEAIKIVLQARIEMIYDDPGMCANVLHAAAACKQGESVRELILPWFLKEQDFLDQLVAAGIRDGSLKPDLVPQCVAVWLMSLTWFLNLISNLDLQDSLSPEKAERMLSEFLVKLANQP